MWQYVAHDRTVLNLSGLKWLLKCFKILYNTPTYLGAENILLLPRFIIATNATIAYVTEAL